MPFVARGPGIPHGESSDDVVVNADLTSTILELSRRQPGAHPGRPVADAVAHQPRPRERPGDPARGLRRRADPRRAHLALPLHRVGRHGNGRSPSASSTTPTPTRTSSPTSPSDPAYAAGRRTSSATSSTSSSTARATAAAARRPAQLTFTTGGTGKNGCSLPPIVAHFSSLRRQRRRRRLVPRRQGPGRRRHRAAVRGRDPRAALRDELPGAATVTAKALFDDGRRLGASRDPARVLQVSARRRRRGDRDGDRGRSRSRLRRRRGANPRDHAGPASTASQPNIVFILTDDQDLAVQPPDHAPDVRRADRRPRDRRSPTTTTRRRSAAPRAPACSPASTATTTACSRTSPATATCSSTENTLPVWLQRAGYGTAIVGQVPERLRERGRRQGRRRRRAGTCGRSRSATAAATTTSSSR